MQTFLVYEDPIKSAAALDPKRRFSQIYEGIHILASNLGMSDKLMNPKRSVVNHPIAKLWYGHNMALYAYIMSHYAVWAVYDRRNEARTINEVNLQFLAPYCEGSVAIPVRVKELILEHRQQLLAKYPTFYSKYGW